MIHQNDRIFSLDGEWKLTWAEDAVLIRDGFREAGSDCLQTPGLNTSDALQATGYAAVPSIVPGNFELDLQRAGKIGDPFFGTNPLRLQDFEETHQYYSRHFSGWECTRDTYLRLDGVDTLAEVFLNGEKIADCNNQFLRYEIPLKSCLKRGENDLVVHIIPPVLFARNLPTDAGTHALPYGFESLRVRKAPSSYGWDIMPRVISGGLWKSVSIVTKPHNRIEDVFAVTVQTNPQRGDAILDFRFQVRIADGKPGDWRLNINGVCGESKFSCGGNLRYTGGVFRVTVPNAALWMPRNYGSPNLYHVCAVLSRDGEVSDSVSFRMGIRTVTLERTSTDDADGSGQFLFRVNGQKIYCMGTNWVPVDAFHSRDRERLPELLPMLNDLGCNMVRAWGGNVYEDDLFYDFCDENGILVWQDFAMACGIYPQDKEFCSQLEAEADQVIRRLRNHCSVALWAGDNECDFTCLCSGLGTDPNGNRLTREVLPAVLWLQDPTRPYLPSSPYIDGEAFRSGKQTSEDHIWGPRDYFKGDFYRNTVCHFASEVGYHGCPEPDSLRRFLSPDKFWGWRGTDGENANDEWLVHAACMEATPDCVFAYRIPLMARQIRTLFGTEPDNPETFAIMSQISQAEADKFFIEHYRQEKWRRTGLLWWNLADGWPQISDAVVDYYGRKKLAYFYIRRSQQPLCLMFGEPENGKITLYGVNDWRNDAELTWKVTCLTDGSEVASGDGTVLSDTSTPLCEIPVESDERRFLQIGWEARIGGESIRGDNHFMTGLTGMDLQEYLRCLRVAGFLGDGEFWFR